MTRFISNLEINGPNTTIGVLPDGTMFNVIYTEKVRKGSEVIEQRNTVSVSQDYLERSGLVNYCEVASTDATKDGFCVYVSENPQSSVKKYT